MAGIFVSYRVADSAAHAGRLADSLKARLAPGDVFLAADDLERGIEWRDELLKQLATSRVLIAVIGPVWSTVCDRDGVRRLDRDDDIVRLEIRESLARGTPVVPVQVGGATLPVARDLPDDIAKLLDRNAVELRDNHWASDVSALVQGLQHVAPALKFRRPRGVLRSSRQVAALFFASLTLLTSGHWMLVRFDLVRAESLRLLPALVASVLAVFVVAHLVARRRDA